MELAEYLEEQPWFFLYWKQDPTIESALTMLDAIHELFEPLSGMYLKLVDEACPRITFQLLELKQFGLSDDLYIKMNARGKPLTAFENFKAKIEQKLATEFPGWKEDAGSGKVSVRDYFSHRIETRWADLFWHFKDPKSRLFDEKVIALYRNLATVTRDPEGTEFETVLQELRGQKAGLTYQRFAKLGCIDEKVLRGFFGTLERVSGSDKGLRVFLDDNSYLDEESLFLKSIDPKVSLSYDELIVFGAYTGYLVEHREPIDQDLLWNWSRVISNLARNTIYNRPEDFQRSLRSLNALLAKADGILEFLALDAGSVAAFNQQQVREEQLKAQLIRRSDSWRSRILEAEGHGYFAGQIEFLFKFCGLLDLWLPERVCDWSEEEDQKLQHEFDVYFRRAKLVFSNSGLREFDEFLWERALLAEGDYLVESGRNHCFLKSEGRETSWKRLLRGDPKKDSEEVRRSVVARVMDQLDPDGDVEEDLMGIIERASVDKHWRDLLVKNPEAIGYCENGLIRWDNEERVFLLKRSQLNGAHADLFTYCLFVSQIRELVAKGELSQFESCEYRSVTDTWNDAGIVLQANVGKHRIIVEVLNSRDAEASYLISCPWDSGSFLEEKAWPALGESGFTEMKRVNESRAMERSVKRDEVVKALLELGEQFAQLMDE